MAILKVFLLGFSIKLSNAIHGKVKEWQISLAEFLEGGTEFTINKAEVSW